MVDGETDSPDIRCYGGKSAFRRDSQDLTNPSFVGLNDAFVEARLFTQQRFSWSQP